MWVCIFNSRVAKKAESETSWLKLLFLVSRKKAWADFCEVKQFSLGETSPFSFLVPRRHFLWFLSTLTSSNRKANRSADKVVKLTCVTKGNLEGNTPSPLPYSNTSITQIMNSHGAFYTQRADRRNSWLNFSSLSQRLSSVNEICMRKHL